MARRTVILAYHNVVPDNAPACGDRSLHVSVSAFARQLDRLMQTHTVVPLTDTLSPVPQHRPRVAITFDDAYLGAIELGLAELARRDLPSTVFVTPGLLGGHIFWWDALASAEGLSPALRSVALSELQGKDRVIRRWASEHAHNTSSLSAYYRSATHDELIVAVSQGRVQLGAHTWLHPALPTLDPNELRFELERPLAWLRERFACAIPWLAYPYGLSAPNVESATREAGYEGACLVSGGWVPRAITNRFAIPRQLISNGLSESGFTIRLSGLLHD